MSTNQIKKALCLGMALLLVAGWFQINVCGAEEVKQTISEGTTKGKDNSSPEVLTEQTTQTTQQEMKSEKLQSKNETSDILKEYVLPILLLPLLPVAVGMQIVCLFVVQDFSRCVGH